MMGLDVGVGWLCLVFGFVFGFSSINDPFGYFGYIRTFFVIS